MLQGSNGGILHPEGGPSNGAGGEDCAGGAGGSASNGQHGRRQWGRYDSSALHIQHALKATEVQRKYSRPIEKPIDEYLVSGEVETVPLSAISKSVDLVLNTSC